MENVVPLLREELKSIVPLRESIMFFTIAKPSPIPPVFVVNFGSKTR